MSIKLAVISDLPSDMSGMVKIRRLFHNRLKRLWKGSVHAFIYAAFSRIPVDTGMTRASFLPLARAAKAVTVAKAFLVTHRAPRLGYGYSPTEMRSVRHGIKLGENAYELYLGTPEAPDMRLEFNIVVFQHKLHELGYQTPPWRSMDFGKAAFLDYWNINFDAVVQPEDIYGRILGRR